MTEIRSQESAAHTRIPSAHTRIHHAWLSVVVLGWMFGSGLGLGVAFALYFTVMQTLPLVAYAIGAVANMLFHHVYYRVVYVNGEIRMRTSLPVQLLLYAAVAVLSMLPLWFLMGPVEMSFVPAAICTTFFLSAANALLVRISTFRLGRAGGNRICRGQR